MTSIMRSCVCVAFPTDATMGMDAVAFPRNPFFGSSYLDISERLGRYSIFFFAEYDIFDFPFGKINVVWMVSTNNIHFIINIQANPFSLPSSVYLSLSYAFRIILLVETITIFTLEQMLRFLQ